MVFCYFILKTQLSSSSFSRLGTSACVSHQMCRLFCTGSYLLLPWPGVLCQVVWNQGTRTGFLSCSLTFFCAFISWKSDFGLHHQVVILPLQVIFICRWMLKNVLVWPLFREIRAFSLKSKSVLERFVPFSCVWCAGTFHIPGLVSWLPAIFLSSCASRHTETHCGVIGSLWLTLQLVIYDWEKKNPVFSSG